MADFPMVVRRPNGPYDSSEQIVRPRLTDVQRDLLLVYLLRVKQVFLDALPKLKPEHFSALDETPHAMCWQAAVQHYQKFSALPAAAELNAGVSAIAAETLSLAPEILDTAEDIINYAYGRVLAEKLSIAAGRELLRNFLLERHVLDPLRAAVSSMGDDSPADLPALLREHTARVSSVISVSSGVAYSVDQIDDSDTRYQEVIPTGLMVLDQGMKESPDDIGGWRRTDCNLLLGVSGGGKTTLSAMIGVEGAIQLAALSPAEPDMVVHLTYETPRFEVQRLALSYRSQIQRSRLRRLPWEENLSTCKRPSSMQTYEMAIPINRSGKPLGELERLADTKKALANWCISEMRGGRDNPDKGSGWVDEMQAVIEATAAARNRKVGLVIVDWAGQAAARYCQANNWDPDRRKRYLLEGMPEELRRKIGEYFNCGIWLLHQLSGEANLKSAGAAQHQACSADARSLQVNCDYTFQVGTKDKASNCCVLWYGKTRRSAQCPESAVLHFNQVYASLDWSDELYTVEYGQICSREAVQTLVSPTKLHANGNGHSNGNGHQNGQAGTSRTAPSPSR